MRIFLTIGAALFAAQALAADRDPYSGAPLPPAKHEPASPITDHFYIRAAFYSPKFDTNFRVDPSNAPAGTTGTPVNAENDLGLDHRQHKGRVDFMFRLRERNKLRVEYYEADRSATQALTSDIVFGDQTFLAGQVVQTQINWRSFGLTYTYSFYRSDRFEVGTGIGVYFMEAETMGAVPATGQATDKSAAEPLPTLPLDLTWCISQRFSATARGNYVKAAISGFNGSFTELHADLQYRWNPNFSIGVGFTSMRLDLKGDQSTVPGFVDMSFKGPEAFIRFSY